MRAPSENFTTRKNATTNQTIWLFDIHWGDDDTSGVLRLVSEWQTDVEFDGKTYRCDIPVQHTGLSEESGTRSPGATIMLGNADRTVEALLVSFDGLSGQKVVVYRGFADSIDPADFVSCEYNVESSNGNAEQVVLTLTSRTGFMDTDFPARVFSSELFPSVPKM